MESITHYAVQHPVILCSYLTQTQSLLKLWHLVWIQGRLFRPLNVNRTPTKFCTVPMTTGHLTTATHNGMSWSDRNDLELLAVDRWTRWLGDKLNVRREITYEQEWKMYETE